MPQPADFPISMRRLKDDGSAEHVYANSQKEWEHLQAAGFSQESSVRVQWPKLLRHPDGRECTVADKNELAEKQKLGYGFPRDVPAPEPSGEPKLVSADEVAAIEKSFERKLNDLQAKIDKLEAHGRAPKSEK